MNNEYVTGLHKYLQGQYGSEFKLNEQQFQDKLNNDPNYINGLHGYLQQQYGSEFKLTPEEFAGKVKKKDQFRFDLESGSRPTQPTSGSKTSQFKPQKFGEFAPLETKKEEDKIEFPGALPESEQKAIDILSQKPSLKFVEDEDLKAYIRQNPKAWTEELIKKNPSLKDQTIDGVLPGLMDEEPTLDNQGLKSIENANTLIDYTKSYDEAFDNMPKESDAFSDDDVKANPKKYRDAVMNDYLAYLKMVNGEDSQTYLDVKERLDYYNSLGDKLYNDSSYADDLKRYQDIQKQALVKVSNNSYSKSIAIENNYDWKYFSKKASNLDVKARNIEKQISELGIEEGKALSTPQKKKYEELMNQYSQVKQEFDKLSEETNITPEVIDQIRSQQGRMSSVMNTIDFIDNDKSSNAQSIRKYKAEMEANKKAQEEFYNTQDDSNLEATGKGVARLGQQAAKTFVNGIFDIAKMPSIVGEAFGAKGYGWSDKLSETAENINSVVELYNPELDKSNFSGFMNLMNDAGQGLGSVAQFATAGAGASRIAKGLQLSEKGLMTANRAAQFTAAASTSTAGLYNELIDAGFTPEEAARYGIGGGIVMGAAEMIVPEDELIKNTIKQSFVSAIKSGATRKEAIENALGHLAKKSAQIVANSGKETFEEGVGSLAESMSKEVASTMTGKKIDGIWDLKNFNSDALAGGQTAFILEMFKFGPRRGRNSNPFEEDLVGYLADNYNEMVETLSSTHPEDYDKIADRYKKLKDIHDGLKNTPSFNNLSKTDQNHVLAQAHAKQVILENIKQSGLSREGFKDEISSIDEDIFQTLNGLRSKDTWVDKSKTQKENAVQEPSTEEVLPREQGATPETGGEPQGMGQSVQGEEVTQEGQEVSQEGVELGKESIPVEVTKLNQETFTEDVTPEQKAKVEEQNQKDEDEAITEIYDFNDEIKSIGTKEQFAQFLRSLSPTAAFSRIAWHNTSKPQLEPREGQYYTNTRKNAEDTYKQENTFPAIVFGNTPKKASFDEVQDVDTEAVKGEGADVVVTDDLSPAIGADMNYREFVPTSADQVIPIGTKENIEAFKAFVEQQNAAPEAKVETEDKVQPEAQEEVQATPEEVKPTEEKEPTTEEQTKMEDEAAKSEAMTPKNMKDLIGIYRKVFNLPYHKALVSAMISNRLVKQMAKRAGVTTEQMYQKLQFKKATEQDLPQGVKMQVDAWHGSPYEFDKFTTEKIGTGEGAQAFGWGLYFTDLESIARGYAEALSKPNINQIQKKLIDDGLSNLAINDIVDFSDFYDYDYDAIIKALNDNQNFEAVEYLKNNKDLLKLRSRNLYEVSLHEGKTPGQYTWLEWDKPMSDIALELFQKFNKEQGIKLSESTDPVAEEDRITVGQMYKFFSNKIGQKEASLFLLKNGIDGIKYPAESVSRGATSETARGFNYVVFDENAVSIKEVVKFQKDAEKARGAMMMGMDGQAIIYALTDANVSTPLHELAHVFEHYLTEAEKNQIIKAAKTKEWTTETSEYFARGFEKYLATGESSNPIFEKFKQFLLDIYQAIKGSPIDVKLNKQMKAIYAEMLGEDLTENLGETLEQNVENEVVLEEKMAKSAVDELMAAKRKRGSKKIEESKNVKEKYGEMGKKLDYIDRNFDKLIDKLGITKSCWLE